MAEDLHDDGRHQLVAADFNGEVLFHAKDNTIFVNEKYYDDILWGRRESRDLWRQQRKYVLNVELCNPPNFRDT